nr:aspartyl/asparaginyl beta-hydroxylase domain-containing protein [Acidiferrobacterales bacterium]
MLLRHRFYRLPFKFDAEKILSELSQCAADEWLDHPNGYAGNSALPLISSNGRDNHDLVGPMMVCARLEKMPYIKRLLSSLNTVLGRTRFMRLSAGANVPKHSDINLYWQQRMRIHIPVITNESVIFESGGQQQHMAAGEAWVVDTWHNHSVTNKGEERIHLVIDTQGSEELWSMMDDTAWKPKRGENRPPATFLTKRIVADELWPSSSTKLILEEFDRQIVLAPQEIKQILDSYLDDIDCDENLPDHRHIESTLIKLARNWQTVWENFGANALHHMRYRLIVLQAIEKLGSLRQEPRLKTNGQTLSVLMKQLINGLSEHKIVKTRLRPRPNDDIDSVDASQNDRVSISGVKTFEPIFILAAPRSGSTLLYETLARHESLMSYNSESHGLIESIPSLTVDRNGSNALFAHHATSSVSERLKSLFLSRLSQKELTTRTEVKFLEKTPKNALRVGFLKQAFSNAKFIYLYRRPEGNISSIIEGWRSGRFITYKKLPEWQSKYAWSFLLPNGWQELPPDDLARIASFQY